MNIKKIKWNYSSELNLKVDRDFALQTIKNGNGILRFNHYWFACPDVGTNIGGLQDMYKAKKDEESAKKMCIKWNPFVTLKKKTIKMIAGRIIIINQLSPAKLSSC